MLLTALAAAVVFSAHRALDSASRNANSAGQLSFTLQTLDAAAALARNPGFESVAAAPSYTAGVFFLGELYLGGPSGLVVLGNDGSARRSLRPGFELPVAAITGMATGTLRGTGGPQLLLATGGAGLLLLEPGVGGSPSLRQLLPADAEARNLTAVLPLATGEVLLGTHRHGVLVYNGATLKPLRFTLPGVNPATLEVTALAAADSASFLIGTRNAGVFYLHAGVAEHADSGAGLPDDEAESIAVVQGRAFVGTPVGTAEFDLAAQAFRPVRTLAEGTFSHALAVDEGALNIGTLDQGIQQVALTAGPSLRRVSIAAGPAAAAAQRVDAFLTAPDALYALADGTLLRRTGASWTPAQPTAAPAEAATLTDANISALAFAPDGTLYVGFFDHGIDLLGPEGGVRHLEDDHLFCINRLALDPQRHTVAAATANGLVLFDPQGRPRQTLTRRDGLISDHVTDVAFTSDGTAVATPAGITFLGPAGAESLYAFQGLVNNHVYALAAGSGRDRLVAGTLGGASVLRGDVVERNLTVANSSLKHNWITALLPMPDDAVLVGTYGAGLETLDRQGRFTPVELPAGLPHDLVINPNALYATATHIYAGTLGHGMLVYSAAAGGWTAITEGLPSLHVTAFAARGGEVYVGTQNGLVRIREAGLP
jgi:hypothetical protein